MLGYFNDNLKSHHSLALISKLTVHFNYITISNALYIDKPEEHWVISMWQDSSFTKGDMIINTDKRVIINSYTTLPVIKL